MAAARQAHHHGWTKASETCGMSQNNKQTNNTNKEKHYDSMFIYVHGQLEAWGR